MAQCVLQKKKIWLVTGSISSLVIDYIHSVLVTVYKLHKPDCSSREPYSNIKIHHIEVHSGYSQVDASSKFADTRWLLQDQLSYIPRYPEYGPRMPKANWTKPYATLLAQWKTNNRHFAMLRLSLVSCISTLPRSVALTDGMLSNRVLRGSMAQLLSIPIASRRSRTGRNCAETSMLDDSTRSRKRQNPAEASQHWGRLNFRGCRESSAQRCSPLRTRAGSSCNAADSVR